MKLNKLCIYDREEWVDTFRVYEVPTGGYVLTHIEDEDLHFFYTVEEMLGAAMRRVSMESPRVGPCPP